MRFPAKLMQTQLRRPLCGSVNNSKPLPPQLSTAISSAALSTHPTRSDKQRSNKATTPKAERTNKASADPQMPSFSFESLGIGPRMRIVVIALICVFGTIETGFYCVAIWRWWKGDEASETVEG